MKKLLCYILILALVFPFSGCGKPKPGTEGNDGTAETGSTGQTGNSPTGEDLFLSLEDLPWRDNSLDAYSAVLNVPLRSTDPEGVVGGTSMYFLGNTKASIFSNYIFLDPEGKFYGWEEIATVTDQGEEAALRLDFQGEKINNVRAGGMAESDHYAVMGTERDEDQSILYHFFEVDGAMQVLKDHYVGGLGEGDYELMDQLQVDSRGNLHMITYRNSDETRHYYIAAPDGTLLTEVSPKEGYNRDQTSELFFLCDGRVGMQLDGQLQCVDVETGKTEVLAEVRSGSLYCTLWDEKTLLYADSRGLYRSDLAGKDPELLYTWSNHGVSVSEIMALQVTEGGNIGLIYKDYKGANYLKLTPTTEEVEILEVTFGVASNKSRKYEKMVAEFNKKHPAYRVRMQTYGTMDTRLLTELIAGEGPVLVDTYLADFKDNAEWWEPLDEAFRQMEMDGELIPKVMDTGRINGTLYGVVTDFALKTVATFAEEPEEWDYDTFLNCFDETDPDLKSVFNGLNGSDGYPFMANFFFHGMEEKYLFDAESCTTCFDSEKFRKILRLASSFMNMDRQGTSEDLRQGTSPCAVVLIRRPEDLASLRIWSDGKLRFIGYPSGEGSRHYISSLIEPITIRANAAPEEKRLARSFLKFLLSYDAQADAMSDGIYQDFWLSVRKDVLEEQINRMNDQSYATLIEFGQFPFGDRVDNELDKAALYGLLEKAEPEQAMPRELVNIYRDELWAYLSGEVEEEAVIDHLENRVRLYLMEQK